MYWMLRAVIYQRINPEMVPSSDGIIGKWQNLGGKVLWKEFCHKGCVFEQRWDLWERNDGKNLDLANELTRQWIHHLMVGDSVNEKRGSD